METNNKKSDDISVYIEDTEYTANRYVLKSFTVTMVIYSIVFLLNILGIFVIEQSLMFRAFIPSVIIFCVMYIVSNNVSLSDYKTKYFILFCVILLFTVTGVFLTYHVTLLLILPFLYATLYTSQRIMSYVYVLSVLSTCIIIYGGYYFGLCDANMALLTTTSLSDYLFDGQFTLTQINPNPLTSLFLFYIFPRCGLYIAFMVVCKDIYKIVCGSIEKAKLSADLEKAKEAAEHASSAKSEFLARMSHEIRTPINAILGMNEMIVRESKEQETRKYALDIKNSANTLLGLINEILDSSKIESGKMDIVPVNYQVSSLLNDLYNMISVKALDKGLKLEFDISPDIPSECFGDDIRIRQVLMNLLSNAVKYTEKGTVTLSLSCTQKDGNVILHYMVKDTGIGIQEEHLDRLFEQFERIEEERNRNIEGTGLGLNIAIQLLYLMDSDLKVESVYEKGSEFSFDIVQKIVNAKPMGDFHEKIYSTNTKNEYDVNYVAPNAKILVVDDNEMNRKVFCNLLKRTGIKIYEASGGTECLTILKQQTFDIIFLDYMMPHMDGVETLHEIQKQDIGGGAPIVMLTANAIVGAKEAYLSEGFDDYLTKPIMPEKLDELILSYLPKDLVSEQKETASEVLGGWSGTLPQLDEFDFDYAMRMLKQEETLLNSLRDFYYFLEGLPAKLTKFVDEIHTDEAIRLYKIEVHALKGTSSTVGAILLSKLARMLEVAAAQNEVERILVLHPILLEEIEKHKERIVSVMPDLNDKKEIQDAGKVLMFFDMLKDSLEQNDYDMADSICNEIRSYKFADRIQPLVDDILNHTWNFQTEEAILAIAVLKNII